MTVKAILSRKGDSVVTVEPGISLREAVRVLSDNRIGALIVTDGGKRVIGMLSERDIVRTLAQHGPAALDRSVDSIMTRNVITCTQADKVSDIMERMTTGRFRHLPVLEGDQLAGVISIGDVVKYRLEEIEAESSALRDYILTA